MKIHIVLVSDQVLANFIPILMERPDRVLLVVTAAMAGRRLHLHLAGLLKERGIGAEVCPDAPDVGLREIRDYARTLADRIVDEHAEAEIVLNATGGTKLMSFGFVEEFRGLASRILYTDTAHRRIEYLPNRGEPPIDPTPMTNALDLPLYLAAQGFRFRSAVSVQADWRAGAGQRKAACKFLGQQIGHPHLQHFIGAMNRLADHALERIQGSYDERLAQPHQSFDERPRGLWSQALGELAQAGLIEWEPGARGFAFADVQAARFLRGGWLEEYAWHSLKDAGAFDVRLGVEGLWTDTRKTVNEFDVLCCHLNHLLVIECKTAKYQDGNDNAIAYKLDSLSQDLRGLFGQTWLLSARAPSDVLTERARRARIRLIGPADLARLRDLSRAWLGGEGQA